GPAGPPLPAGRGGPRLGPAAAAGPPAGGRPAAARAGRARRGRGQTLRGARGAVTCVAYSPDGRRRALSLHPFAQQPRELAPSPSLPRLGLPAGRVGLAEPV